MAVVEKVPICILEDHAIVQEGLRAYFKEREDFVLEQIFTHGKELLDFLEKDRTPRILLLDLHLPGDSGLDISREIRNKSLPCKIVLYTVQETGLQVQEAKDLLVDGYLLKSDPLSELIPALKNIWKGAKIFSESTESSDLLFSNIQIKIMDLLCRGRTQTEIGEVLQKSRKTIEYHLNQMRKKASARNNTELVARFQTAIRK